MQMYARFKVKFHIWSVDLQQHDRDMALASQRRTRDRWGRICFPKMSDLT